MVQATAAFAGEERRFAAMARICAENGGDVPSAARLATLERETTQRLAQVQYVLQQTRAKLAVTSKLNFVQRDRLNDQIKELAAQESWLSEQLAAVKALTGTGADPVVATATGTAANLAAAPAANNVTPAIPVPQADPLVTNTNVPVVPLEAAQAMYSAAYTKYAELIKTRDTNDPAVTAALQQLREAEAVRAAAMQKAGRR